MRFSVALAFSQKSKGARLVGLILGRRLVQWSIKSGAFPQSTWVGSSSSLNEQDVTPSKVYLEGLGPSPNRPVKIQRWLKCEEDQRWKGG